MNAWELVAEARRRGLEFRIVGGSVHVRAPTDELDDWVNRLRHHRDVIGALLVDYERSGKRGSPVEVALAAALVGVAIGVLSAGGRLSGAVDLCISRGDGTRVCRRCVQRSERDS